MPIVTQEFELSISSNDPSTPQRKFVALDMLLSDYYSKNIRNGNKFTINGLSLGVRPHQDMDTGLWASCMVKHIPCNRHSRKAWNMVFNQWRKQKRLTSSHNNGPFPDFEIGWQRNYNMYDASRTSLLYTQGLDDSNREPVFLIGESDQGTDVSLADYYNSLVRTKGRSIDIFTNDTIGKPHKFEQDSLFPLAKGIQLVGATGANLADNGALSPYVELTHLDLSANPINTLTGSLGLLFQVGPDDVAGTSSTQVEDTMTFVVSFWIKKWKPLVYRPRRKKSKKSRGGKSRGRSFTKSTRWRIK